MKKKGYSIIAAIVSIVFLYGLPAQALAQPVLSEPLKVNVWLDPSNDTGAANNDNITNDELSRIFVQVDLSAVAATYAILDPAEIIADEEGVGVAIILNCLQVGYGKPIAGTNNSLFKYSFLPGQLSTTFIPTGSSGGLNTVTAGVVYKDGGTGEERIGISSPMMLTLDTTAPDGTVPNLAPTNVSKPTDDNKLRIKQPAFVGTGEPGATVILYANETIVGRGMVDSQGQWEVTSALLAKGEYEITTKVEDRAGNISNASEPLMIQIKR